MKVLIAIPVFNEERHVMKVLAEIRAAVRADILVIDDGSTDATPAILARRSGIRVLRHRENFGYGKSLADAFHYAAAARYDWVITMDCDEQHEPASLGCFIAAAARDEADIISGSRYLLTGDRRDQPPPDRRNINILITQVVNRRLGLHLTDSFCGFKAHRVAAMDRLRLTEPGYAFPMQFWVQAVRAGLRIAELPVRLIYHDPSRHFGGHLDDPNRRLRHYLEVFFRELEAADLCTQCAAGG